MGTDVLRDAAESAITTLEATIDELANESGEDWHRVASSAAEWLDRIKTELEQAVEAASGKDG